jgi:hypothetical protein
MCQVVAGKKPPFYGVYTGDFLGYMWYIGICVYIYGYNKDPPEFQQEMMTNSWI